MAVYYIDFERKKRATAGAKAPGDINRICRKQGFRSFSMPAMPQDKPQFLQKLWLLTVCPLSWMKSSRKIRKNDVIIYQHPMYGARVTARMIPYIKKKKGCRFIALIHDLETLRGGIEGVIEGSTKTYQVNDRRILPLFDHIICHNASMKKALVEQGIAAEKLVTLEIFDYLTDEVPKEREKGKTPSIAIAGNLAYGKSRYLYDIKAKENNKDLTVHLFGLRFEEDKAVNGMIYHGSYSPEELPGKLEGDFGLVWDGSSAETCAGNTGNYLRYNDPHKTSLYLASGMPVVTWSEAAIADFILKKKAGFVVNSLSELEEKIKNISDEEYLEMCRNARKISVQLRQGFYFKQALKKCGVEF